MKRAEDRERRMGIEGHQQEEGEKWRQGSVVGGACGTEKDRVVGCVGLRDAASGRVEVYGFLLQLH